MGFPRFFVVLVNGFPTDSQKRMTPVITDRKPPCMAFPGLVLGFP